MRFLVTGAAGFIGSHLIERLLAMGHEVKGVDCFIDFYPRRLKELNLENARQHAAFSFAEQDVAAADLKRLLDGVEVVIHLAAQAGVRTSWGANFQIYTHNNILSTQNLLEAAKEAGLRRLVYASSSSVYGDTPDLPMKENGRCRPISPYGVTKLAGEHLCRLYNKNFGLDVVSLRYFTVYGPRQRPDMAFHRFIRAILENGQVSIYGDGSQSRDFTYISDIVQATVSAALTAKAAGGVFNIGGGGRVRLKQVIGLLEEVLGKKAQMRFKEKVKGDVKETEADTSLAGRILGFAPQFDLKQGLAAQIDWMRGMWPVLKEG